MTLGETYLSLERIRVAPISHIYSRYKYRTVTVSIKPILTTQVTIQYLRYTTGINKATIKGSCSPILKNVTQTGTVNNRSTYFSIFFIQRNVINRGPQQGGCGGIPGDSCLVKNQLHFMLMLVRVTKEGCILYVIPQTIYCIY